MHRKIRFSIAARASRLQRSTAATPNADAAPSSSHGVAPATVAAINRGERHRDLPSSDEAGAVPTRPLPGYVAVASPFDHGDKVVCTHVDVGVRKGVTLFAEAPVQCVVDLDLGIPGGPTNRMVLAHWYVWSAAAMRQRQQLLSVALSSGRPESGDAHWAAQLSRLDRPWLLLPGSGTTYAALPSSFVSLCALDVLVARGRNSTATGHVLATEKRVAAMWEYTPFQVMCCRREERAMDQTTFSHVAGSRRGSSDTIRRVMTFRHVMSACDVAADRLMLPDVSSQIELTDGGGVADVHYWKAFAGMVEEYEKANAAAADDSPLTEAAESIGAHDRTQLVNAVVSVARVPGGVPKVAADSDGFIPKEELLGPQDTLTLALTTTNRLLPFDEVSIFRGAQWWTNLCGMCVLLQTAHVQKVAWIESVLHHVSSAERHRAAVVPHFPRIKLGRGKKRCGKFRPLVLLDLATGKRATRSRLLIWSVRRAVLEPTCFGHGLLSILLDATEWAELATGSETGLSPTPMWQSPLLDRRIDVRRITGFVKRELVRSRNAEF